MSHPPAVCEKAQRLERLLQRLEAGERLASVRAELGLGVTAAEVPDLRAKYEAGGRTWEALLDGRYGHPQTAHSALREWMYQRKREDPTLTAGQVAEAVAAQFGVTLSAGHVNYLLRQVELTRPTGRPSKAPTNTVDMSAPATPPDTALDQAGLFSLEAAKQAMDVVETVEACLTCAKDQHAAAQLEAAPRVIHSEPETIWVSAPNRWGIGLT